MAIHDVSSAEYGPPWRFKLAVSAHIALMLLEIAAILITLLKVFSDMRAPEGADIGRLRGEAAFAMISCLCTVGSFCVNVFGMSKLIGMLRAAASRIRPASIRFSSRVPSRVGSEKKLQPDQQHAPLQGKTPDQSLGVAHVEVMDLDR